MKTKNNTLSLLFLMASIALASCSFGKGDMRDRNLEQATLARLDSVSGIRYVGMTDTRELADDKFEAVVIYYVTDSIGNRTERNARVTTNKDCSKVYSWEDVDSRIIEDVKQKVSDKMEEKGITLDENLIDDLIELKKR